MRVLWASVVATAILSFTIDAMTLPDDEDNEKEKEIVNMTESTTLTTIVPPTLTSTVAASKNRTRHAFFRSMDKGSIPGRGSRRVFGGAAVELKEFPTVCALLDRYWAVRCTAAVLTPHWVLTAAHCITPRLAYVKYNTRRPASTDGNVTAIHYLYRHPKYEVQQKDEGHGLDVTVLHHDVGLVRTRDPMALASVPLEPLAPFESLAPQAALAGLRVNNPYDLFRNEVQVFGFGRTERSVLGEELFGVQLRLVDCSHSGWLYCVCGVTAESRPRGVCSGDSGGPVVYNGTLVAVTSMGPTQCARAGETPPVGATSVFTSLYQYADVINATILDTEVALRMRVISRASSVVACRLLFALLLMLPVC